MVIWLILHIQIHVFMSNVTQLLRDESSKCRDMEREVLSLSLPANLLLPASLRSAVVGLVTVSTPLCNGSSYSSVGVLADAPYLAREYLRAATTDDPCLSP